MENLGAILAKDPNFRQIWASDTCDKHGAPARMVQFGDEVFCAICEKQKSDAELSKRETERIAQAFAGEANRTLETLSIITDDSIKYATLDDYEPGNEPEVAANKEKAQALLQRYRAGDIFNLWINGKPGVGKSHLAMSILRELNQERGRRCLFVAIDPMFRLVRDSFKNKDSKYSETYFMDLCAKADFLVLDDLGAEVGAINTDTRASDFVVRILKAVAESRQTKPTIVTTNLSSEQLSQIYDGKVVSRLLKNYELIVFKKTTDKRIAGVGF